MNTLHIDLLATLRASAAYGLSAADLLLRLRAGAHRALTLPEIETALRDLADRSLVAHFTSPLSGARWRLTALGASALQEEGL